MAIDRCEVEFERLGHVTVRPEGIRFTSAVGETVMAAAIRNGYRWPSVCHGSGECLACRIEVLEGAENLSTETDMETKRLVGLRRIRAEHAAPLRLACQAHVEGDVVVMKRGVRTASQRGAPDGSTP